MTDIEIIKKALTDILFCGLDVLMTPHDKDFYIKEYRKILEDIYKIGEIDD